MKIAVISSHTPEYEQLAKITVRGNRADYCKRHGYDLLIKTDDWGWDVCHPISWERLAFLFLQMVRGNYEWFWVAGTDTLNTNFNIKLEDRIDENFHFIISCEWCSPVQADSFLVRNSKEGLHYIAELLRLYPKYHRHPWVEQQAMIDTLPEFKSIIKILPQRAMNSYDYGIYREKGKPYATYPDEPKVKEGLDWDGQSGQWEAGDFLIHWPGTPIWARMDFVQKYLPLVVK